MSPTNDGPGATPTQGPSNDDGGKPGTYDRKPPVPLANDPAPSTDPGTHSAVAGVGSTQEIDHNRGTDGRTEPEGAFGTVQRGMFGVRGSGDTSGFGGLIRQPYVAPQAERPYGGYFDEVADSMALAIPGFDRAVTRVVVDRDELTFYIRREELLDFVRHMRDDENLRFELCSNVSGVDYVGTEDRLHVVYDLRSMTYRRRVRLEVAVSVEDPHVPSVTEVYPTADWQERETWDMFGVIFDGHPGLTRILMPDDWDGHPQRKDYPLGGIPVEYKGASIPPPDQRRSYR